MSWDQSLIRISTYEVEVLQKRLAELGEQLRIGQTEVDALLRGSTRIGLSVARDETGTEIRRLDLAAATLSARVSGRLQSTGSDLRADLKFDDLVADLEDRVERRLRLLKDHRDAVAAHLVHLIRRQGEQLLSLKADGASHHLTVGLGQQPHDGENDVQRVLHGHLRGEVDAAPGVDHLLQVAAGFVIQRRPLTSTRLRSEPRPRRFSVAVPDEPFE